MENIDNFAPQFLSREQQERRSFYKDWLRDALLYGLAGLDQLISLRQRVSLADDEVRFVDSRGLDKALFEAAAAMIDQEIATEVKSAVADLQTTIFEGGLFKAGIIIDGQVRAIDGVAARGQLVLPLIDGQVYDGPFDEVVFDR
jgi:hypothetical protein